MSVRCFIAFDIEDELLLRRFSEVQGILVNTGAALKLVEPRNIHITMRFLGNTSIDMITLIHQEMKKVSFTPFDVEIRGLGAFPSLRYARVVWAGVFRGVKELRDIFGNLEPRLRKLGFKSDPKGFSPHLTIARVKSGRHKTELTGCIHDLADYEFGVVKAECLRLKKSVLTPKGPVYSTLKEICP